MTLFLGLEDDEVSEDSDGDGSISVAGTDVSYRPASLLVRKTLFSTEETKETEVPFSYNTHLSEICFPYVCEKGRQGGCKENSKIFHMS